MRRILIAVAPFLLLVLVFQFQKYVILGFWGGMKGADLINYPYAEGNKLVNMFLIFAWCVKLVFIPYPLRYSYAYNQIPAADITSPGAIAGFILAFALLFYIFKGVKQKTPVALGLLIFGICLAPAMGFVLLRGGILAERFLYAPVLGFGIVMIWLLAQITKVDFKATGISISSLTKNRSFTIVLLAIFTLYSVQTISRSSNWHNELSLVSHDVNAAENNCQVHLHYGTLLVGNGIISTEAAVRNENFSRGLQQLNTALQINPRLPEAWYQIAQAYQKLAHNPDSAIIAYNNAIRENPSYAPSYLGLATLYESINQQQLASYYYNKAIERNPLSKDAAFYQTKHKQKTGLDVKVFPSTATIDSTDITVPGKDSDYYNDMGKSFGEKGDFPNAVRYISKALELNPNNENALVNLSVCFAMTRNYTQSIEALEQVLRINPNNETALSNVAIMYGHIGNNDKAAEYKKKLQDLKTTQ